MKPRPTPKYRINDHLYVLKNSKYIVIEISDIGFDYNNMEFVYYTDDNYLNRYCEKELFIKKNKPEYLKNEI